MTRKFIFILAAFLLYYSPLKGQSFHVSLNYQSFQPFIEFQLNFSNHRYSQTYRMAYLKGYMDGVNDHYRYDHRYRAMVHSVQAYKAGYRDGFHDRGLLIRLRGRDWLRRNRFSYRDYYSPVYSVRIWLKGLSIAFRKAPVRRVPPGWRHRAYPPVRRGHRYHRDYDDREDYYEEYYEEREEYFEERAEAYEEYYEEYEEDD